MSKTILIMAGGTGGHIFPALAVAHQLRDAGWRVVWLGNPEGMEARLVPQHGFEMVWVKFSALRGKGLLRKLLLPFNLLRGFWQGLKAIRQVKPNVVLGMGEAALRVVEPACAYLASILSHDGSKVPVAPNAWRIEQGVNTGMSGPEIQESMSNDYFTTYVEGLRDIRRFVSGNEAIAYYVLDIREAPGIESTMLAERFKVEDGLITEIEVVFAYCRVPVSNATAPDGTDMCPKDASPPPPVA
jgi:UDP:flavonoid glycosyltransferase YjiC (YdhE family)